MHLYVVLLVLFRFPEDVFLSIDADAIIGDRRRELSLVFLFRSFFSVLNFFFFVSCHFVACIVGLCLCLSVWSLYVCDITKSFLYYERILECLTSCFEKGLRKAVDELFPFLSIVLGSQQSGDQSVRCGFGFEYLVTQFFALLFPSFFLL